MPSDTTQRKRLKSPQWPGGLCLSCPPCPLSPPHHCPRPSTSMTPAFLLFCKCARLAPSQGFCACGSLCLECSSPQLTPSLPFSSLLRRPLLKEGFLLKTASPHPLPYLPFSAFLKDFLYITYNHPTFCLTCPSPFSPLH